VSATPPDRPAAAGPAADAELDLRREVCPYTFLQAKLALEPMAAGQVLRVIVGNETSARDVPRSLTDAGHAVLAVEPAGAGLWRITVQKGSPRRATR
jgi:TusA-related sulfurtransferase